MAMPYIGSKISLISKAEIRYEGILYTIDMAAATVALSDVRSFGTEDRPAASPVAPSAEVFRYIIFRGSDIKDLHVLTEAPQAAPAPPADPAIMSTGMGPPPTGPSAPQPTFDGDFDFAKANAMFDKDALAVQMEGTTLDEDGAAPQASPAKSPAAFYDQKTSFFDTISGEANRPNGEDRRAQRSAERATNSETFGSANVNRQRRYGRGRGRGGRRGGGGRGRGNGWRQGGQDGGQS